MAAASDRRGPIEDVATLEGIAGVAGPVLVREVRAILRRGVESSQLLDHILVVDTATSDESLHRVIPLPRCVLCGGAAAFPRPHRESSPLSSEDPPEAVLEALEGWVDLRTGVISGVFLEPPSDEVAGLPFVAIAAPPHIMGPDDSLRRLPLGWGKGLTVSGAVLSAVGEAIERYSASLPDPARILWERAGDLDGEFLDPRALARYTEDQYERDDFPYTRFDPDVRHPWVAGKWIDGGSPVWVPAVFVFLSLAVRTEHVVGQGSSNGLAAWTDPEGAARRAILELVERDACMTAWLTATPGRRILIDDSLDPSLRHVLEGVEALGATVEVYILPTSVCGVTVLCLGLGDGEHYPGVTLGLGADLDPRAALRQAVLELGQTGPYLRRMMRSGALPVPDDPGSVQEMLQHAAYYFPRERAAAFDRLRNHRSPLRAPRSRRRPIEIESVAGGSRDGAERRGNSRRADRRHLGRRRDRPVLRRAGGQSRPPTHLLWIRPREAGPSGVFERSGSPPKSRRSSRSGDESRKSTGRLSRNARGAASS